MFEGFLGSWRPPDDELMDLIEVAFLEGQIDGEQLSLASAWVESETAREH